MKQVLPILINPHIPRTDCSLSTNSELFSISSSYALSHRLSCVNLSLSLQI